MTTYDGPWAIESRGFRIGPDWYTEAAGFATKRDAVTWMTTYPERLPADSEFRVTGPDGAEDGLPAAGRREAHERT